MQIPDVLTNVVHEVELGVIIGSNCKNVLASDADKYIAGYCLGLDLSAMCELVSKFFFVTKFSPTENSSSYSSLKN